MNAKDRATRQYIYDKNRLLLKDILAKVKKNHKWTKEDADYADLWYRNFLWLCYLHRGRPVFGISARSDELWHAHIVYTKRYRAASTKIFKKYMDHNPISGRPTVADKKRLAQSGKWYELEFGGLPVDFSNICYFW